MTTPVSTGLRSGPTVASYFGAFSPDHDWEELVRWPPDVFALTNLILDHTEAYRFAVSPPPGSMWPPSPGWDDMVTSAADHWRASVARSDSAIPRPVAARWAVVRENLDTRLAAVRRGNESELREALLTLHAMADEAARGLTWPAGSSLEGAFEQRAWALMADHGSLSSLDPTRVRITPKTHSASRGITIRSMSRYLALGYESIEIHWRRIEPLLPIDPAPHELNLLLIPWPLVIGSGSFRPTPGPLTNMDRETFGFFRFQPEAPLDLELLGRLVEATSRQTGRIDAVIFPEAAVDGTEVAAIEDLMNRYEVASLFIGAREAPTEDSLGHNYVHVSVRTAHGWESYRQAKHHRWCLDENQIRQYHLSHSLTPRMLWWEAIDLPARTLEVIDVGGGAITAPLVCEDLARMDEVAALLRGIGPSLVIALLLDGPQLSSRWPCRYATVFAEEPGSAVLTLSSLGMVSRSRPPGKPRSRVVAMWNDPVSGLHEIELGKGASGILLTASAEPATVWTADGRRHERNTPTLTIERIRQLRPSPSGVVA